jgi:regulator of RNase E activity RraA
VTTPGDLDFALAGGNVCAIAQRRGIAGFVLDGLIRDIGEVRKMGFPVFARGVNRRTSGKRHTLRTSSGSFLADRTHPASGRAGRWLGSRAGPYE